MRGLVHHQAYWKAGYIYMLKLQILLQCWQYLHIYSILQLFKKSVQFE